DKACGRVGDRHPGNEARIERAALGDEYPVPGPVDDLAAAYVARADRNVRAAAGAGRIQAEQVFRIMREVRIHLEDVRVAAGERPFKAVNIGSAKAELAAPLSEVK